MPASIVYALVQSMTFMVDTIIAGHFLGSDAVAGVALGIPIIGLMLSFTGMILQGATSSCCSRWAEATWTITGASSL